MNKGTIAAVILGGLLAGLLAGCTTDEVDAMCRAAPKSDNPPAVVSVESGMFPGTYDAVALVFGFVDDYTQAHEAGKALIRGSRRSYRVTLCQSWNRR